MKKMIPFALVIFAMLVSAIGTAFASEQQCWIDVDEDPAYTVYTSRGGEQVYEGLVTEPLEQGGTVYRLPVPGPGTWFVVIEFPYWTQRDYFVAECTEVPTETPTNTPTPEVTPEITPVVTEEPTEPPVTTTPEVTPEVTEEPVACLNTYPDTTVTVETLEDGTVVTTTTTQHFDVETGELCGDPVVDTEHVPASPYTWCGLPNSGNEFSLGSVYVLNPTLSQVHVADNLDGYTYLSVELNNHIHYDGMEFEIYDVTDGGWEATGQRIRIVDIDAEEEWMRCEFVEAPQSTQAPETSCEDCPPAVCLLAPGTYVQVANQWVGLDSDSEPMVFATQEEAEASGLEDVGYECSYCVQYLVRENSDGVVEVFITTGATRYDIATAINLFEGSPVQNYTFRHWDMAQDALDLYEANNYESGWYSTGS